MTFDCRVLVITGSNKKQLIMTEKMIDATEIGNNKNDIIRTTINRFHPNDDIDRMTWA